MRLDLDNSPETDSSGRLRTAEEIRQLNARQKELESLVRGSPDNTMARIQLASLLLARGRMQAGSKCLVEAVPTLSDDIPTILQLARLLQLCGETVAARSCLDHPALGRSDSPNVMADHANQRYMIGEVPLALEILKKAIAAGADGPGEQQLLATLLQYCGKIDEAAETFEHCLQRWPRFGSVAMARSRMRRQTPDSNHVDFLQSRLKEVPADPSNKDALQVRAEFEFALFKELDDLGRYDEAWEVLERGNAKLRLLKPYDAEGEEALTDALIEASGNIPALENASAPPAVTPIFVVGMPRSGTTLLDRMLSSHSKVVSAGELKGFKRHLLWAADVTPGNREDMLRCLRNARGIDYGALANRYLAQTEWSTQGKPYFIDKQPLNIQLVPFIRRAFPNAPILHIVRDPMAVCFSNYKIMYGQVTSYNNDFESLAHYYKQNTRLVDHWNASSPGTMLHVDYSALVNDPEGVMCVVLDHCKLDLEEDCIHPERNASPVATPSSIQVREPIYKRSTEDWQKYAKYLEPLKQALMA